MQDSIKCMHIKFTAFTEKLKLIPYTAILSEKEYIFITYAIQGISNRDIAEQMKLSEKTVSHRFTVIYDKLGVKNKQELIDFIIKIQNSSF